MAFGFVPHRNLIATFMLPLVFVLSIVNWLGHTACASELVSHNIDSAAIAINTLGLSSKRYFQVYLPDGYEENDQRYPVFYWIPGWGGQPSGWFYKNALDDAINTGRLNPLIVVFITSYHLTFLNSSVHGNWGNFMASELISFIDKEYRTLPDKNARALMGHSMGGYSALMLPVLYPGVWGSIGDNDPSCWAMWFCVRSGSVVRSYLRQLPEDIEGYKTMSDIYVKIMWQLGWSFSPNHNDPLRCDFPTTPEGEWIPEVREKWSNYDLSNPQTLAKHSETLKDLLSITIVVPQGGGNGPQNITFIKQLETEGIGVTRLDMPGGHGDYSEERFVSLAEQILLAMEGAEVAVSPSEKTAITWGQIKQLRW
jgi:pimeloyl-ACP methyl ester carboxylesterase